MCFICFICYVLYIYIYIYIYIHLYADVYAKQWKSLGCMRVYLYLWNVWVNKHDLASTCHRDINSEQKTRGRLVCIIIIYALSERVNEWVSEWVSEWENMYVPLFQILRYRPMANEAFLHHHHCCNCKWIQPTRKTKSCFHFFF